MKIATWNIAGGHPYRGSNSKEISPYGYDRENLSYFTRELGLLKPTVAVLQEVHFNPKGGGGQSDSISSALRMHATKPFIYDNSHIEKGKQLSLATVSTDPARETSFYELPHLNLSIERPDGQVWTPFSPTGFFVSEIPYQGQMVTIVNTHLHPFHYFERDFSEPDFQEYRDAITQFFLAQKDRPTIIAGDFNYANLTLLFPEIFKEGGFSDAFSNPTTPEKGQQDHILFSRHWQLIGTQIKRTMTDHYLSSAELSLEEDLPTRREISFQAA